MLSSENCVLTINGVYAIDKGSRALVVLLLDGMSQTAEVPVQKALDLIACE